MARVVFVCGLMGCGKTTFARQQAKQPNYIHINFDEEYHTKIQEACNDWSNRNTLFFVQKLASVLNTNPSKNYVVDNWFKWHVNWWRDTEDHTLQTLETLLKYHEIQVIYMFSSFEETYKRYIAKHEKDTSGRLGGIQAGYKDSMEDRQANLLQKVSQWAIQ